MFSFCGLAGRHAHKPENPDRRFAHRESAIGDNFMKQLSISTTFAQLYPPLRDAIPGRTAPTVKVLVASIVILIAASIAVGSLTSGRTTSVIHQLRIYEIFDSNKKAFHDRFRDHAMRVMAKYDFKIVPPGNRKKIIEPSSFICSNGPTRKQ
jgi:hypothetical protein